MLHVGAEKQLEIQVSMMVLQEQVYGTTVCLISSQIETHLKFNFVGRFDNNLINSKITTVGAN